MLTPVGASVVLLAALLPVAPLPQAESFSGAVVPARAAGPETRSPTSSLPVAQIPNLTTQREVKADVVIQVPVQNVWDVLTDLPAYAIWNPYISRAAGELKPGEQVEITLHEGTTVTYKPTVLKVERPRELSWGGSFAGFDRILTFALAPVEGADPPQTRVEARELFRGLLLLARSRAPDDARYGLDQMIHALRDRVELLRPHLKP